MISRRALIVCIALATLLVAAASAGNVTGRYYGPRALQEGEASQLHPNASKIDGQGSVLVQEGISWNALIQVTTRRPLERPPQRVGRICTGMLVKKDEVVTVRPCCNMEDPFTTWIKVIIGAHNLIDGGVLNMRARPFGESAHVRNGLRFWAGQGPLLQSMCIIQLQAPDLGDSHLAPFGSGIDRVESDTAGLFLGWGAQNTVHMTTTQLKSVSVKTTSCADYAARPELPAWLAPVLNEIGYICTDRSHTEGGGCSGDAGGPSLTNSQVHGMFIGSLPPFTRTTLTCNPSSYADVYLDISLPEPLASIRSEDRLEDAKELFTVRG